MTTEFTKLIGSPKQVAWAENIRENNTRFLDTERKALAASISTARWWIDHRNDAMTLELLVEGVKEDAAATEEEQDAVETRARRSREWNTYQHNLRFGTAKRYDIDNKLPH